MPDDDRLRTNLPPGWRAVARALEHGHDLDTFSALTEKALAATIRNIGGVPTINEICDQAYRAARARCGTLPVDGHQVGLSPQRDRLPQTDIAWGRARVLLETHTEELAENVRTARHRIAVSVVRAVAYHFGFGRIVPRLVDHAPWSADDLRERCAEVLAQPGIDKLADSLLRHPSGLGVKAPRRVRPSTESLLETPLGEL